KALCELLILGHNPVMPRWIAALRESDQNDIQQVALPKHIQPGILGRLPVCLVRSHPVGFSVIEDSSFVNNQAFACAHECLQVKVPGLALEDGFSRMQL